MNIVLDACALIAFLRDEPGAEVVESLFSETNNSCMAHAINLCEVYYDFLRAKDEKTALEALADLESVGLVTREEMNSSFWQEAGKYKVKLKVSLADCFAIALARLENALIVTSDHNHFEPVAHTGICGVKFIR